VTCVHVSHRVQGRVENAVEQGHESTLGKSAAQHPVQLDDDLQRRKTHLGQGHRLAWKEHISREAEAFPEMSPRAMPMPSGSCRYSK
jgi:hypothetical protein